MSFVALRGQIEIGIEQTTDGLMCLSQFSAFGENRDEITFDPRLAPRLAAAILEASGYENVVFTRHLGGLAFTDLHLDEPPDAENPHLADTLAQRERDRERLQRELDRPEPKRRNSGNSAAERQRRHRERKRNARDGVTSGVTERDAERDTSRDSQPFAEVQH